MEDDKDYFDKLGREESIKILANHEQNGTLDKFIKEVAPHYLDDKGETMKFNIIVDKGW